MWHYFMDCIINFMQVSSNVIKDRNRYCKRNMRRFEMFQNKATAYIHKPDYICIGYLEEASVYIVKLPLNIVNLVSLLALRTTFNASSKMSCFATKVVSVHWALFESLIHSCQEFNIALYTAIHYCCLVNTGESQPSNGIASPTSPSPNSSGKSLDIFNHFWIIVNLFWSTIGNGVLHVQFVKLWEVGSMKWVLFSDNVVVLINKVLLSEHLCLSYLRTRVN